MVDVGLPLVGDGIIGTHRGDEHRVLYDGCTIVGEALAGLEDAVSILHSFAAGVLTHVAGLQGELLALLAGGLQSLDDRVATPGLGTVVEQDVRDAGTGVLADFRTHLGNTAVLCGEDCEGRLKGAFVPRHRIAVGIHALTVLIQNNFLTVLHSAIMITQH